MFGNKQKIIPWLILIGAAMFFVPFTGRVHLFDWDEINFAECAREMIVSDDYLNVQIGFRPFWEKPPLFIWMQVLSMKAFGINEFAARFPNAVCGIITLLLLYTIGKKQISHRFGTWWALIYASSVLPHLYFRSGIIDPWFNLFIFLSVYLFILYASPEKTAPGRRKLYITLSGIAAGLAMLTKGPVGVLLPGLVIAVFYAILAWRKFVIKRTNPVMTWPGVPGTLLFFAALLLTGGSWFIVQWMNGHSDMVMKFIHYQVRLFTQPDAGHGGHWSYHFWVLLFGVFPASIPAIGSLSVKRGEEFSVKHFHWIMSILFWTVLLMFSIVKTKIVHYSSLAYFPLTFMAAYTVHRVLENRARWHWAFSVALVAIAVLFALLTVAVPLVETYKNEIIASGLIKDDFALGNLRADVKWTGFEWVAGLILLAGTVVSVLLVKKKPLQALRLLFATSLLFTWLLIILFPYRIEKYSQGAVIEFYKSKADEKCYVLTSGYFTYAPMFYLMTSPDDYARPMWLLTGKTDRPVYLVLKEPHYREWKHLVPAMKVLYMKNGWVFLQRADR